MQRRRHTFFEKDEFSVQMLTLKYFVYKCCFWRFVNTLPLKIELLLSTVNFVLCSFRGITPSSRLGKLWKHEWCLTQQRQHLWSQWFFFFFFFYHIMKCNRTSRWSPWLNWWWSCINSVHMLQYKFQIIDLLPPHT